MLQMTLEITTPSKKLIKEIMLLIHRSLRVSLDENTGSISLHLMEQSTNPLPSDYSLKLVPNLSILSLIPK